jgi:uncharacterized membrane protein (DUF485 family)
VIDVAEKVSPEVHAEYERIHATPEFAALKAAYRKFVLPTTVAFMVWYLTYVLLSNYAGDFMGQQVFGNVNVALLFGLLQFVTTFAIAYAYARYSAARMDPIADELRDQFERKVG